MHPTSSPAVGTGEVVQHATPEAATNITTLFPERTKKADESLSVQRDAVRMQHYM